MKRYDLKTGHNGKNRDGILMPVTN